MIQMNSTFGAVVNGQVVCHHRPGGQLSIRVAPHTDGMAAYLDTPLQTYRLVTGPAAEVKAAVWQWVDSAELGRPKTIRVEL